MQKYIYIYIIYMACNIYVYINYVLYYIIHICLLIMNK